jgi:hypothetical protein
MNQPFAVITQDSSGRFYHYIVWAKDLDEARKLSGCIPKENVKND